MKDIARERDQEIDRRLETVTPSLERLSDLLYDNYSTDAWGLERLAALEDEEQRAIASDLVLSALEGVQVNLRELALPDIDVQELVGPRGQLMTDLHTTVDDIINNKRLHRAITDLLRALGSTIDCMAAVTIGVLGLPHSLQLAAGAQLLAMPELPKTAPAEQHAAREATRRVFDRQASAEPAGWLAWALELRDAVVHRGHLSQIYLQRPGLGGARVKISSRTPERYIRRMEPHLRARPWLPDMLTLTTPGGRAEQLWLPEPAQVTTAELRRRTVALVDSVAGALADVATAGTEGWVLPAKSWALARDVDRTRTLAASEFAGFDPKYPTEPLTSMAMHSRSAGRIALAEKLRVRLSRGAEQRDDSNA